MTLLDIQTPPTATHRAVAHMTGSLPMGGQVADTPVFAFHHTPAGLEFGAQPELCPQRRDISLDGLLAFEISDVLTAFPLVAPNSADTPPYLICQRLKGKPVIRFAERARQ